jgi:hypothetical protein
MVPGDAIIHTRYLFHRSDDFSDEGRAHWDAAAAAATGGKGQPLLRYSVRYMPGDAPIDFPFEAAVKERPELLGQPMSRFGDKWFPKV